MTPPGQRHRLLIETAGWLTFCCLYIYFFFEWLFFATKPSFVSSYSLLEQLGALWIAPLFFLPGIIAAFTFCVIIYLLSFDKLEFSRFTLLAIVPAAIISTLTVLLIDNFTYTVFKKGIVTMGGDVPYLYLLIVIAMWGGWCIWVTRIIRTGFYLYRIRWISLVLLSLSLLSGATTWLFAQGLDPESGIGSPRQNLPDIILFTPDAIEADRVSSYGHFRQTTPNLDALVKESLIVYNTVSNAGRSTGSLTAILTGKYPTTTKVIFPPHALRGRDAYQHLPGILKKLGYFNLQESVRYYTDSRDLNMRAGFDHANGRKIDRNSAALPENIGYKFTLVQLFVDRLWLRVKNRALHLVQYRPMENAFDIVNPDSIAKVYGISDQERISRAIELIKRVDRPVFAHIHLMESHCCRYRPEVRQFSASHGSQNSANVADYYDDAILSADKQFGLFVEQLRETDRFDNTLIIFTSDHTRTWRTSESVPLIMRFPNGEYAGRRRGMSQLIDIAPTIIDYLGLSPPVWMEGRSLLSSEADFENQVFTVDSVNRKRIDSPTEALTQLVGGGPPLFGLKTVSLIDCRKNHILDVANGELVLEGFRIQEDTCTGSVTAEEAKNLLETHLVKRGFELPYM